MDERFIIHRLKSTRLAALVGVIGIALLFEYEFFKEHIINYKLFAVMLAMGLAKVGAMIYYRIKN